MYVWLFDCNLSEALIEDIKEYESMNDFFSRELKPGSRPLDVVHDMVSEYLKIKF